MSKYSFKPYSNLFPKFFSKEKTRIRKSIGDLHIEHIGSTAIPQVGGKGIIDILVAADKDILPSVSAKLQDLGYEFRPIASTNERKFFRIDLPDGLVGTRRYHLHLTFPQSEDWRETIAFRDYLRNNKVAVKKYNEIKKQASEKSGEDGDKYKEIKEPFIRKILSKNKY